MTIPALQNFIDIDSLSPDQFWGLMRLAKKLKAERMQGGNAPILAGKSLALLFQKPSLRTRVSFEMGMEHLGGYAFYLSPAEVGLGSRESAPDVARVLSGYADGIMARVFDHAHILQMAEWGSVPIINGLSDFSHPCQALTDIFTIWENLGQIEGMTLAYVGDGASNVATSLIQAAAKVDLHMVVVAPEGYQPDPAMVEASGAQVTVTADLDGVAGADVIYTDVWTSMGQEAEREKRLGVFPAYQVNSELVARTGKADTQILHCLPAHRGEEITDDVADGPNSLLFPQAHNRLHAQKAILAHVLGGVPLE